MDAPLVRIVASMSAFAKVLLCYSLQISERWFPGRVPKILPVRAVAAYFPFCDVVYDSERRRTTASEVAERLKDHLSTASDSRFSEMSSDLIAAVAQIDLSVTEKLLHSSIERTLTLDAVLRHSENSQEDPLLAAFASHVKWKSPDRPLSNMLSIAAAYVAAETEPLVGTMNKKNEYLRAVAQLLGLTKNYTSAQALPAGFLAFNATGLLANSNLVLWLCYLSSEGDIEEQILAVRSVGTNSVCDVFIVCILGDYRRTVGQLTSRLMPYMSVTISQADIVRHFMGRPDHDSLSAHVLSHLPLSAVSPYATSGAARETFVGRREQLDKILQSHDSHFAVVGPRKIGKTSLLEAIARIIASEQGFAKTLVVCVDATNVSRISQFQESLYAEFTTTLSDRSVRQMDLLRPSDDFFRAFARQISAVVNDGMQLVILIDEIDSVLSTENSEAFEAFCRSVGNRRKAKIVVFGYTKLAERLQSHFSAFYNLFEEIVLGPLEQPAALELVVSPMRKIGISFESDAVVEKVVELCSRIPWHIQAMCKSLIGLMNEGRTLSMAAVMAVYESREFTELLLQRIRSDKSVGALPLLILYIVAKMDDGAANEQSIVQFVERIAYGVPFSEVRQALLHLTATYLLKDTATGYRFYIDQQRRRLNEIECVDETIEFIARDLRRAQPRK